MSLLGAWAFDEGTGTTTADASGNGRTLTLDTGVTWTSSGHTGNAVSNAGSSQKGAYASTFSSPPTSTFTLLAWCKPTDLSSGQLRSLLGLYDAPNTGANTCVAIFAERNDFGTGNVLQGNARIGGTLRELDGPALTLNTWTHLAITYDGATFALYKDGSLVTSMAVTGAVTTAAAFTAGGAFFNAGQCVIDDARVYSNALTLAQIVACMNTPVGTAADPTLLTPAPPQAASRRASLLSALRLRRRPAAQPVPTAAAAGTSPVPSALPRRRPLAPFLRRRPTVSAAPPPTPSAVAPRLSLRRRAVPPRPRRTFITQPVPALLTVTAQALPPQPARRARAGWLPRPKPRQAVPPAVQLVLVPAAQVRRRQWPLRPRRASSAQVPRPVVVTAQALPPQPARRARLWLPRPRRGVSASPTPAGAVVTVQALPPQPRRARVWTPRARRGASTLPVQVTVTAQALPPQPARSPRAGWLPRSRPRATQPVVVQAVVVPQPAERGRLFVPRPRRGFATTPVLTVTVTPPAQQGRRVTAPWPRRKAFTATVVHRTGGGRAPAIQMPPRRRLFQPPRRRAATAQPPLVLTVQLLPPQPGRSRRWFPGRARAFVAARFRVVVTGPTAGVMSPAVVPSALMTPNPGVTAATAAASSPGAATATPQAAPSGGASMSPASPGGSTMTGA